MAMKYVAYTQDGQRVTGTLPVDSTAAAEEMLWRSELIVTSLRPERESRRKGSAQIARLLPTLFRPKTSHLVSFTRELATLLDSGIPLHTSLNILRERIDNPIFSEAIDQVAKDIEAGGSLSLAVSRQPQVFPTIYYRLMTVGEETGRLDLALQQVANHLEKQANMAQKVRKSLSYPSFVAVIGLVAVFFLLTFALPGMTGLFEEFGAELPLTTRILILVSDIFNRFGKLIMVGMAAITVGTVVYFRSQAGAPRWDRLTLRIPFIGKVVRHTNLFRFTGTVSTLLTAGLPLTEALDMTANATGNSEVRAAIRQVRQDLMTGQSFSQALSQQDIFPNLVRQMVSVGEDAGTLHQNLESLSSFYEREADRSVSSFTGMIEPAMILMVGGMVAFIAMALMSTMYGVIGQIK